VDISAGIQASLAGRYASALFDLASEAGTVTAVESDLETLAAALAESSDLRALTTNPQIGRPAQGKAIEAVAGLLGNTKSVCRKCYIHPAVIDAYLDRSLLETLEQRADALAEADGLRPEEQAVLRFLRKRLAKEQAA